MVKVSVIIPVYNAQQYLRDCLDSILQQTLTDLEVICIDDGSTDNSREILNEYASKDTRVSVYAQENAGQGTARNYGVDKAQGKYLHFVDCDDLLTPDALELLYERAEKDKLDVLYYKDKQFAHSPEYEEAAEQQNEQRKNFFGYLETNRIYSGCEILAQMVEHKERQGGVCYQFFSSDFYRSRGLRFPEGIIHEDELVAFQCLVSAERAGYASQELYLRRLREASTMHAKTSFKNAYGYFVVYFKMLEFYETQSIEEQFNEAVLAYMKETLYFSKKRYKELADDERQKALELPLAERLMFEVCVSEPSDEQDELKQLKKLKDSRAYKVGDAVLWLPKKIRGAGHSSS